MALNNLESDTKLNIYILGKVIHILTPIAVLVWGISCLSLVLHGIRVASMHGKDLL